MSFNTTETLQRLMQTFLREQLAALPPEQRQQFEQQFEDRFNELLKNAANGGAEGFLDLIGFGGKGPIEFENLPYPHITPDFDDSVVPSQLHAAAELYYIYQHERMKIFQVIQVLRRLFQQGRMRIQRGPGARALYTLEKWMPLRYTIRDRMIAYRRAFNYGTAPAPAGAIVNSNFHRQLTGFMVSLAQYFRDLLIGEVIRGGPLIEQRPFGSIGTVQRLGLDLRYALDRSTYGNIFALTVETGHYLKTILQLLDAPDIKKSFDANTKWDVIEAVSNRYLNGIAEPSQRAKMAESGRRILQFVADNDFKTAVDPILFQSEVRPMGPHSEAWIAAYRMTPEGRGFTGVTPALRSVLGARSATQAAA
ncbi:MAG: hypothetical protein ACT4P5_19735 [Armatimonadota bacterium]